MNRQQAKPMRDWSELRNKLKRKRQLKQHEQKRWRVPRLRTMAKLNYWACGMVKQTHVWLPAVTSRRTNRYLGYSLFDEL
jgi:hypothetical protein